MTQKERLAEKKRLVELLIWNELRGTPEEAANELQERADFLKPWAEKCADYLLSNGAIVPPCKVGDTVYELWYTPISEKRYVQPSIVRSITFTTSEWFVHTEEGFNLYDRAFKKDWFTDREEAEQALKERETK